MYKRHKHVIVHSRLRGLNCSMDLDLTRHQTLDFFFSESFWQILNSKTMHTSNWVRPFQDLWSTNEYSTERRDESLALAKTQSQVL